MYKNLLDLCTLKKKLRHNSLQPINQVYNFIVRIVECDYLQVCRGAASLTIILR